MRYPAEHKEETRARIVAAASRSFRRRGGRGIGIAGLMEELDLTHGGFYRHFRSKEQLFAATLSASLEEMEAKLIAAAAGRDGMSALAAMIDAYLSPVHCADPAGGCPIAALGPEVPRHPEGVRRAYQRALGTYAQRMSRFLPGKTGEARTRNFYLLFGGMAGSLALARSMGEEKARGEVLRSARSFYRAAFCRN